MDAPLGRAVGNAIEVIECIEVLKGRGPADIEALSWRWRRECWCSSVSPSSRRRREQPRRARRSTSGEALERFRRMVERQGGDPRVVDDYSRMPRRRDRAMVVAPRERLRRPARRGAGRPGVGGARRRPRPRRRRRRSGGRHRRESTPGDAVRAGDPVLELHTYNDDATRPGRLPSARSPSPTRRRRAAPDARLVA